MAIWCVCNFKHHYGHMTNSAPTHQTLRMASSSEKIDEIKPDNRIPKSINRQLLFIYICLVRIDFVAPVHDIDSGFFVKSKTLKK